MTNNHSPLPGYGNLPRGNAAQLAGYGNVPQGVVPGAGNDVTAIPDNPYDVVDMDAMLASMEQNKQAATQKAQEVAYWQEKTLARQKQTARLTADTAKLKGLSSEQYALEAMDPKHRVGELLNIFMDEYNRLRPGQRFFDWVDAMTPIEQLKLIARVMEFRGHHGVVKPEWIAAFNRGVKYIDAGQRGSYRITIQCGTLYQNGQPFDTGRMSTEFSGQGYAIFVEGKDGDFYSASHKWGRLHHSSFLSGEAVRCAGEWQVSAGKLLWLSGKSGHYKPTMQQFATGLGDLKFENALGMAECTVWQKSDGQQVNLLAATVCKHPHGYSVWG
jgi:hypothetical protein